MRIPSITSRITYGLIGSGLLVWTITAGHIVKNPDLDVPLNPLGIKRSPYGEVFAMAMQGPIDNYFINGMGMVNQQRASNEPFPQNEKKHESDGNWDHDRDNAATTDAKKTLSPNSRLLNLITSLNEASELRTNPRPASDALKRHMRHEAEIKLRFAYELDPSHYGNYNSLHFFLSEPQVGTRPQLDAATAKLAQETINYCLKQENDPRPALTAAAACTNMLHLMFTEHNYKKSSDFTVVHMRQALNLLDDCLNRYNTIAKQWDESKNWELLSPMRVAECEERYRFISKIRDAAAKTVVRIESEAQPTQ